MLSRVSLMCRPKAFPPRTASTGQCSSCHCCSACGARARLGQHHAGECGTGPAAHQAAWQAAGTPMLGLTVAEYSHTAFSIPALAGSVGDQEYVSGKLQSRLAALSEVLAVSAYECVRSACVCRQLANNRIAQKLLHLHTVFDHEPPMSIVHAEFIVKTFLFL